MRVHASPRDFKELLQEAIFLLYCASKSSSGRARDARWHSVARSKSFEGEGEIPLAGFTPCQS